MIDDLWDDDNIQFPRLLVEIVATQDLDIDALCASMDLRPGDINELFDRANEVWEIAKNADLPCTVDDVYLGYTTADDGVHLFCHRCGWDENLGLNATATAVSVAAESHATKANP